MTRIPTICLSTAILAGCATVESNQVANNASSEGLTYFLPARYVKLTATKETLDPPKIKAALEAKTKELDAAKAAAAAAEQNAKAKAAIVAQLPSTAAQTSRDAAVQASELAQAEAAIAAANRDGLASTVAGLRKLLETAQAAPADSCGYSAKLELLPAHGDRTMRFVARPRHNALRDDSTKLSVTADGLLASSNVIAADRTGDIIVEIAGAIAGFSGAPVGVQGLTGGAPAIRCDQYKKIVTIFDPAKATEYEKANKDLSSAGYPLRLKWMNEPSGDQVPGQLPTPIVKDVIYYRTPVPAQIRISECPEIACGSGDVVIEDVLVSVPQVGPISYIPQRSSAFVRTVNDVQFENGVIKSWSADRPSEVLEVVRLPVRILTAIVSVPANLIQLRVNHDTQAKSLAEIQAAERVAAMKLQILQACLNAAGDDSTAAKGCLSQ